MLATLTLAILAGCSSELRPEPPVDAAGAPSTAGDDERSDPAAASDDNPSPSRLPGQVPRDDDPSPAGEPAVAARQPAPDDLARALSGESEPVTVVLDPGHGGDDAGAIGGGIVERESNLNIALRVEEILVANGYRVVLTRRDSGYSVLYPENAAVPEAAVERTDLQARVDLANQEGAAVFVSIHSNFSVNPGERGLEIWYDPDRPFSLANFRLGERVFQEVAAELITFGYPLSPRGLLSDRCHGFDEGLQRCLPLFVLGPPTTMTRTEVLRAGIDPARFAFAPGQQTLTTRATQMPAMLVELLFQSNAADAAMLRSNSARQAMARGVARGIMRFLESDDRWRPASPLETRALGES